MVGVGVPEDQGELGVALDKGRTPHLGFDICNEETQRHHRVNMETFECFVRWYRNYDCILLKSSLETNISNQAQKLDTVMYEMKWNWLN